MWHAAEEGLAASGDWQGRLEAYSRVLLKRYPFEREQVTHWHDLAAALFPVYVEHWEQHPDVRGREPLLQEHVFDVPYMLPSKRMVRLRGKWDAVDMIDGRVYLGENKTKSQIDQVALGRQLTFDLQTCFYLIALGEKQDSDFWDRSNNKRWRDKPVAGVRYNVVRRSAHKGSRNGSKSAAESMLEKLEDDRKHGRIGEWFARWNVEVTAEDTRRFRRECLDPVLENLCDDYEWWCWCAEHGKNHFDYQLRFDMDGFGPAGRHFRMPYFYNPLIEGGSGEVDEYLANGSTAGLQRVTDLFPELR